MEQARLRQLEEQCIQDCPPPCSSLCPVHVDVRQLTRLVAIGDFPGGYGLLRKTLLFPGIIARTCDQPCQQKCYRKDKGGAIEVALLERACVEWSGDSEEKVVRLPRKDSRVGVIGGGLSGMTAAYELSKKGYQVTLFEQQPHLGGSLWEISDEQLPRDLILLEMEILALAGVEIKLSVTAEALELLSGGYDALYLGTGRSSLQGIQLDLDQNGKIKVDPHTYQTSHPQVFAGGSLLNPRSTILSVSDGRRAAISIDRAMQKVSLSAARSNEGVYETRLVTKTERVESVPVLKVTVEGSGYSIDEAKGEAQRCIQCECMECVKECEYLKQYGSYPRKYVREIYNNLTIIMRTRTSNKFINSCTACGLCKEVCPTDLDMGEVTLEARQTMVRTGKMPISAHDFALRDMAFSNGEKFNLALCPDQAQTCSQLFFPGCQLAASSPEYVHKIYQALLPIYPDLGILLRCCGAPAEWAGETEIFGQSLEVFRAQWENLGKPRMLLACSSCNQVLKKYLPQIETRSIWEVFDEYNLYPPGRSYPNGLVIHDPCTSRYESTWLDSARAALTRMGISFHELEMSRNLAECCGYGGVAWLANPQLVKDMIRRRIAEDGDDYLTYCAMCRDLLSAEGKRTLHLLDLVFGEDPARLAQRKAPDYSQRHENRMRVKQKMLNLLAGKGDVELDSYENYQLDLSAEMRERLESRLILVEDVQKVIEHAETSGERFLDQENGHSLAFFKPNLITYWVEYSREGEKYRIHDAYSHRITFESEAGK